MTGTSAVVIQSPQKTSIPAVQVQPAPKVSTKQMEKVDVNLKARGRTAIAEKAFNRALNDLAEKLSASNLNISKVLDSNGGIRTVAISDKNGKTLVEMPPKAMLEIADKARDRRIGFLIDTSA